MWVEFDVPLMGLAGNLAPAWADGEL